jgi:hypothetical protein
MKRRRLQQDSADDEKIISILSVLLQYNFDDTKKTNASQLRIIALTIQILDPRKDEVLVNKIKSAEQQI